MENQNQTTAAGTQPVSELQGWINQVVPHFLQSEQRQTSQCIQTAKALSAIKFGNLYKSHHSNFKQFFENTWKGEDMNFDTARKLALAGKVWTELEADKTLGARIPKTPTVAQTLNQKAESLGISSLELWKQLLASVEDEVDRITKRYIGDYCTDMEFYLIGWQIFFAHAGFTDFPGKDAPTNSQPSTHIDTPTNSPASTNSNSKRKRSSESSSQSTAATSQDRIQPPRAAKTRKLPPDNQPQSDSDLDEAASTSRPSSPPPKKKTNANTKRMEILDGIVADLVENDWWVLDLNMDEKRDILVWPRGQDFEGRLKGFYREDFCKKAVFIGCNKDKLNWEHLYDASTGGQIDRGKGGDWERKNFETLFKREEPRLAMLFWSKPKGKWKFVLGKMEDALSRTQYAYLLAGVIHLGVHLEKKMERRDKNSAWQATRRIEGNEAAPLTTLDNKEPGRQKEGYSNKGDAEFSWAWQMGAGVPTGSAITCAESMRLPVEYARGGVVKRELRNLIEGLASEAFQHLKFLHKVVAAADAKVVADFYQKFPEWKRLMMPGWTLNWKLMVGSHIDLLNSLMSFTLVMGYFTGGYTCIPSFRMAISSPGNSVIWGYTGKVEHYISLWEALYNGAFRCSFVFHFSNAFRKLMEGLGTDPIYTPQAALRSKTVDVAQMLARALNLDPNSDDGKKIAKNFFKSLPAFTLGKGKPLTSADDQQESEDESDPAFLRQISEEELQRLLEKVDSDEDEEGEEEDGSESGSRMDIDEDVPELEYVDDFEDDVDEDDL